MKCSNPARRHSGPFFRSFACWLLLAFGSLLLGGCATGYDRAGAKGGYAEEQLGRNVFLVTFDSNSHTSQGKATDLCLLRCAEVTLANGFSYFVVLGPPGSSAAGSNSSEQSHPPAEPGRAVAAASAKGGPSSSKTIACFLREPARFPEAHEAQRLFDTISTRYGLAAKPPVAATQSQSQPQFSLFPIFLLLPRTEPDCIVFLEPGVTKRTILIGGLTEWENPCGTLEEFKRRSAAVAATLGAQAIRIRNVDTGLDARGFDRNGAGAFVAELCLVPAAQLGIQDGAEGWPRHESVIQGFDPGSLAPGAGLQIGDRIVTLNGTDVLRQKRFVDQWLSWSVGADVVVSFVRDGTKMTTQVRTIAN